jgi:hypothetical protein
VNQLEHWCNSLRRIGRPKRSLKSRLGDDMASKGYNGGQGFDC